MTDKTHTFPSKRGHNLVGNKVMQAGHTHCDIINVYIIKTQIEERQRSLHREGKYLSSVEGGVSVPRQGEKKKKGRTRGLCIADKGKVCTGTQALCGYGKARSTQSTISRGPTKRWGLKAIKHHELFYILCQGVWTAFCWQWETL